MTWWLCLISTYINGNQDFFILYRVQWFSTFSLSSPTVVVVSISSIAPFEKIFWVVTKHYFKLVNRGVGKMYGGSFLVDDSTTKLWPPRILTDPAHLCFWSLLDRPRHFFASLRCPIAHWGAIWPSVRPLIIEHINTWLPVKYCDGFLLKSWVTRGSSVPPLNPNFVYGKKESRSTFASGTFWKMASCQNLYFAISYRKYKYVHFCRC